MSAISIELAMKHLLAEPEDQELVEAQLAAAEEAAMQFLNRRFFATQEAVAAAKAGVLATLKQARAANATAVDAAMQETDELLQVRLLDHARQALAAVEAEVDAVAYGIPLNAAITAACLLKLGHLFANREEVITDGTPAELPQASKALLMPYRVRMGV